MDDRTEKKELTIDKDSQINVVVNSPNLEEDAIDLGRVFHNMKVKRRIYAWVLVFCLLVGICAPLVLYQINKPMLTVTSVVTLDYEVPVMVTVTTRDPVTGITTTTREPATDANGRVIYNHVKDLTAPDGEELDLTLITSSYVLQQALNNVDLEESISLSALRGNISIEKVLTDDSRRIQELASQMLSDKSSVSAEAYEQLMAMEMEYNPVFVVQLTNGFQDDEDSPKVELSDEEMKQLLDNILIAYNDYLVLSYADLKLPDDEISIIDTDHLDLLESLDLLRTAMDNLYDYCDMKPDNIKLYRSSTDGQNLAGWMETIKTGKETAVDYLYSYVYNNSIVRDQQSMITSYQYQLRNAQTELDTVNDNIKATKEILDQYKNDSIVVSMQESDTARTTQSTTDYYNRLITQQANNYAKLATLETTISDLNDKIAALEANSSTTKADEETIAAVEEDLKVVVATCKDIYASVKSHMEGLMAASFYSQLSIHTVPQGKLQNFLAANAKKIAIGAAAGIVIACGLWFLAGLAPEFRRNRKKDKNGEEAAE